MYDGRNANTYANCNNRSINRINTHTAHTSLRVLTCCYIVSLLVNFSERERESARARVVSVGCSSWSLSLEPRQPLSSSSPFPLCSGDYSETHTHTQTQFI